MVALAPYGYKLEDGKLFINEEEAVAIRTIFDQYVNTTIGANGISKYLENHGIRKIPRQNGKNPLFDAGLIRKILKNPVYNGKIAFGRRTFWGSKAKSMDSSSPTYVYAVK
ncbi:site-specific recombinase%2C resolvase family protein [Streptococcus pneumoniae]|nr:site-specific recombinase%2C resolvase family protein [Streptococcus pneumoniae]